MSDDLHILYVEVTVAVAMERVKDGHLVGDNLADSTVAFGWRCATPPEDISDLEVQAFLAKGMTGVFATITGTMKMNGWVDMGQVDEPLTEHSHDTGGRAYTEPVMVRLLDGRDTVHD